MITMLLGGLWHGAATKFIIWGGLHGAALAIHKLWMRYMPEVSKKTSQLSTFITGLITFHFVAFCWIYFRADNVQKVKLMLKRIGLHFNWSGIGQRLVEFRTPLLLIALGFLIHFLPVNLKNRTKEFFITVPDVAKVIVCAVIIFVCYQAKTADVQPFIYFQF